MKTVIVTNGNLLSLLGLGGFLCRYHQQVAAVAITTRLPSQKSNVLGVLSMLRKSGYHYTHFKLLTNLLLPRRLRRRGLPSTGVEFMRHLGATAAVIETPDVNQPEIVERLRGFKPEILLSYSATTRFDDPLIGVPSQAAINLHYALLPEYAGLSPYFWYLRNRATECGVTLHSINSRLDAGPIIEQRRFSMEAHPSVFSVLLEQTVQASVVLQRFYAGETAIEGATPQELSRRSYFRHPSRGDVRALFRHGHRFYEQADLARCEDILQGLATKGSQSG